MDEAVAAVLRMRADIDEIHEIISRPFDSDGAFAAGVVAGKASGFKFDFSLSPDGGGVSTLDRVLTGVRTVIIATEGIGWLKGEMTAIDACERDLDRRVTFIEGVLAAAGVAVRPPRLPRE